jgi:hypothetical protein
MQRRGPPSQVMLCCAVLCCAVLCCCAVQHPLPPSCTARHYLVVVSGRSCVEGGSWGNVGVLVLVVMLLWYLGRWCGEAGATKVGLLPAVRSGLVGVDAAEHLGPSCSIHHDVLPCRGWYLAEEEADLSRRSLVVAAVAVVAVAVTAVLCVCVCGGYCMVCMW